MLHCKIDSITLGRINQFDCEDEKLNSFLFKKAIPYQAELLSTTTIILEKNRAIGYYSLLTDNLKISKTQFESNPSFKKKIKELVSFEKRFVTTFPAIKIGRLGIDKQYKGKGLGKLIVNSIIIDAIKINNQIGCKFITVDAYQTSTQFYEKLGFKYLTTSEEKINTRIMYFDLTSVI